MIPGPFHADLDRSSRSFPTHLRWFSISEDGDLALPTNGARLLCGTYDELKLFPSQPVIPTCRARLT